jgi:iron(III) transport system substrate-binding protein
MSFNPAKEPAMINRRSFLAAAGATPLAVGLHSRVVAQAPQKAVLYTSNNAEAVQTALGAIRLSAPSLVIQQVTGGTGVLMKRIEAEATNPGGDVFWSGGFGTLGAYLDNFEPYASPEAAAIPTDLHGPNKLWAGTNVHVKVMMVNAARLGGLAAPTTWSDLLAESWKGKVAMADPVNSSLSYIQINGMLKQLGPEALKRFARNVVIISTTGQVPKGVSDGEFPAGITSEAAAYEYVAGGQSQISLVYAREGTFLSPEGMGIIKGAKNRKAAEALHDAFLSKAVQEAVLMRVFRRPSRSDIKVSELVKLPEMSAIKVYPIDQFKASGEYATVIEVWKAAVAEAKR